jgi:hypothetical protein
MSEIEGLSRCGLPAHRSPSDSMRPSGAEADHPGRGILARQEAVTSQLYEALERLMVGSRHRQRPVQGVREMMRVDVELDRLSPRNHGGGRRAVNRLAYQ